VTTAGATTPAQAQEKTPRVTPAMLLLVLAAVPVAAMLIEVLRAPRLHFLDYWWVFNRVTNDDGSLHPRGVFTYQNEHPMFVPGLLFWLEAKLLGGRNQALGVFDVVVTACTVLLLNRLLPRGLGDVKRAALTVAFAFLLFSTSGLHNFGFGFSGTGWLTANLAAVGALVLAQRDRQWAAIAAGIAGCLCYGTTFAVWPALALVNWLRGRRAVWVVAPLVLWLAVLGTWALTHEGGPGSGGADRPLGLDSYVSVVTATLGQLWSTNADVATAAGTVTALLLAVFAWFAVRDRLTSRLGGGDGPEDLDRAHVPWIGVAAYAVGAAVMISVARVDSGVQLAVTSRYASIPALALCALVALAAVRWPAVSNARVVTAALAVGLVTFATGAGQAHNVRGQYAQQQLLATAMRVQADQVVHSMRADPGALPATRALGAYPFNDGFSLGCGRELGGRVDLDATPALPAPGREPGTAGFVESAVEGDSVISGWAIVDNRRIDCVLVVDGAGTVVGGGMVGYPRADLPKVLGTPETRGGWRAVAPPGLTDGTVLAGVDGRLYRIDGARKPATEPSP
jgi:hypothetical protein